MAKESKEDREERKKKERESDRKLLIGATSKPAKLRLDNSDLVSKTRR